MYDIEVYESIYDELRQGPGPHLGPRLNGYGYPTIIGPEPSLRYPGSLVSGLESLVSGLGSLVAVP